MANKKEIKRRIKSIKNIAQVTRVLQMVSAAKMRKSQSNLASSSNYYNSMVSIFNNLVLDLGEENINKAFERKIKHFNIGASNQKIALVLISPTRGFAGSLLSNLTRKTIEFIEKRKVNQSYENNEFLVFSDPDKELNPQIENKADKKPGPQATRQSEIDIKLITIEKKSSTIVKRTGLSLIADFPKVSSPPVFEDIIPVTNIFLDEFNKNTIDEVYIIYTHFINTFTQKAVIKKILPFDFHEFYARKQDRALPWYTYSDDNVKIFQDFYLAFIQTLLFQALLDALAAEHSARMIAMKNATDNAIELKDNLTFEYNQKRQAGITQEIAEITSAAETI